MGFLHVIRRLIWLWLRWHPPTSNEASSSGRRTWCRRGDYRSAAFHLTVFLKSPPVCLAWAKIKELQKQTVEEEEKTRKKFNDNKNKSLGCQNSMSSRLTRKYVICWESRRGKGSWKQDGTAGFFSRTVLFWVDMLDTSFVAPGRERPAQLQEASPQQHSSKTVLMSKGV